MMLSVPALTTSLPGKRQGKRVAQEDLRPEVKMGITQYYISISSRLITGLEAEMQEQEPWGPSAGSGWLGGQRAVSPQPQGLLCTPFQLHGCCSSLKLK